MQIKVKEMMSYGGHSLKANGSVDLTLKAQYSQCAKSMQLLQMLNNDVKIQIKKAAGKSFKIGMFRIKEVKFGGDGESIVKFNTLSDFADVDEMNNLIPSTADEPKEFAALFAAEIEDENEREEE
jgi:hypothetical protein